MLEVINKNSCDIGMDVDSSVYRIGRGKMSDTQKWWQKALAELQQHMTDDPALVVTQDRIWWASANFVEQASVIFKKYALNQEDVELETFEEER